MGHTSLIVLAKVIGIFNWNIPRAGWVKKKLSSGKRDVTSEKYSNKNGSRILLTEVEKGGGGQFW